MKESDYRQRFGRFRVHENQIHETPEVIARALSGMLITRAEQLFAEASIEYTAMSPLFDQCAWGQEIPWYEVFIVDREVWAERAEGGFPSVFARGTTADRKSNRATPDAPNPPKRDGYDMIDLTPGWTPEDEEPTTSPVFFDGSSG